MFEPSCILTRANLPRVRGRLAHVQRLRKKKRLPLYFLINCMKIIDLRLLLPDCLSEYTENVKSVPTIPPHSFTFQYAWWRKPVSLWVQIPYTIVKNPPPRGSPHPDLPTCMLVTEVTELATNSTKHTQYTFHKAVTSRIITLSDNYQLPIPFGSHVVLTQPTQQTAHTRGALAGGKWQTIVVR